MPSVLRVGQYRFFFYSNEYGEPPHIHIQQDTKKAKFWISPIKLSKSTRFSPKELRKIEKLIKQNESIFLEAWNEYFSAK